MPGLPEYRRIVLLSDGQLGVFSSKTVASLLRYRADDVVAVIAEKHGGSSLREIFPIAPDIPILADVATAAALEPDALFVAISPVGGALSASMREQVTRALSCGIDIVSGLHTWLCTDEELVRIAAEHHARIFDVRRPPTGLRVAAARARAARCVRILTVGTDCNVGKMVAAIEIANAARRRGLDTRFIATGQTSIMISGGGVAVDGVISDFAAGAIEQVVLDAGDADVCVIEGQGGIAHAGFSGVTLSTIHGACPDALVLVHTAGRTCFRHDPRDALPQLDALCNLYERTAALVHPAAVTGVALNCHDLSADARADAIERVSRETGRPVADVLDGGAELLLDAALEAAQRQRSNE